jgi:hypothetical protein
MTYRPDAGKPSLQTAVAADAAHEGIGRPRACLLWSARPAGKSRVPAIDAPAT